MPTKVRRLRVFDNWACDFPNDFIRFRPQSVQIRPYFWRFPHSQFWTPLFLRRNALLAKSTKYEVPAWQHHRLSVQCLCWITRSAVGKTAEIKKAIRKNPEIWVSYDMHPRGAMLRHGNWAPTKRSWNGTCY